MSGKDLIWDSMVKNLYCSGEGAHVDSDERPGPDPGVQDQVSPDYSL